MRGRRLCIHEHDLMEKSLHGVRGEPGLFPRGGWKQETPLGSANFWWEMCGAAAPEGVWAALPTHLSSKDLNPGPQTRHWKEPRVLTQTPSGQDLGSRHSSTSARRDGRTGGSVKNNRGLELVPAPKQRANAIWTFNPPGSHFSGETNRQAIECERGDACHLRRGPSRTWRSRRGTRRCMIPPC